jgi:hypothetical protein
MALMLLDEEDGLVDDAPEPVVPVALPVLPAVEPDALDPLELPEPIALLDAAGPMLAFVNVQLFALPDRQPVTVTVLASLDGETPDVPAVLGSDWPLVPVVAVPDCSLAVPLVLD